MKIKQYTILTLAILFVTSCAQQQRYPPFDETEITQLDIHRYVLIKHVMVKEDMTNDKAEQFLLSSIEEEVITLCNSADYIETNISEFNDGLTMSHGYTLKQLKKRNFEIGIFKMITTNITCKHQSD